MAKDSVSQIKKLQAKAQVLLDERGIATVDETQHQPLKKFVHFWVLVGKSFVRNRCPVRASALAYTTLLALIPLLAVGLGVSTKLLQSSEEQKAELIQTLVDELAPQLGLVSASNEEKAEMRNAVEGKIQEALPALLQARGPQATNLVNDLAAQLVPAKRTAGSGKDENADYRQKLVRRLQELIPRLVKASEQRREKLVGKVVDDLTLWTLRTSRGQDEASQKVVEQIKAFIANVHSGALGLSGTIALVFVAIGLLSTIEATFNDIWGVTRGRNWFVRIIHYWAAITLGPLVVILAMGLAVGSQFQVAQDLIEEMPIVGGLIFKLIPFFVLSGSFMLLYQLMPNTKVHWKAALGGGVVAGVLWVANGKFNALFASRVVSASKIYGSLSAIPIFLFGLYLSWTILLFGAQVAYAFQNRRAYVQEKQAESVNQRGREFIALRLMTFVGQKFHRGDKPPSAGEIAEALEVSSRLISHILQPLLQCKLLVEVATPEPAYCPARPMDRISYEDILHTLRAGKGQEPATRAEPARDLVRGAFDAIRGAEQSVAKGLTLQTMVERADAQAPEPGLV
jgi:membrane protein